jgi:hypothetical protein
MNKLVRPVSAVALAAAIAGAITILPSLSDRVDASAAITVAMAAAPVPVVTDKCAEQHWPYMDADCVRDNRRAESQAKPVSRVVKIDRKMAAWQSSGVQENRFTASTALSPPKANEFDSAASTFMWRASFGTQSISQDGSGPR